MPVKRRFGELTGGTGDVNPQTLILKIVQSGNDVQTQIGTPLPIPRLPTQNGRSIVMEILSLQFDRITLNVPPGTVNYLCYLSTNPLAPNGGTFAASADQILSDPRVLATWNEHVFQGAAANTCVVKDGYEIDLTDSAGHGILIATDNIFFGLITAGSGSTNTAYLRIEYRFKEVSLQEYIGIVQSQQ